MGPEVQFVMLTFIMFGYTYGQGHGYILEPCKQYITPCARTKKREGKKDDFVLRSKYKKREERQKIIGVRQCQLHIRPPKYVKFRSFRAPTPHHKSVVVAVLYLFVFYSAPLDLNGTVCEDFRYTDLVYYNLIYGRCLFFTNKLDRLLRSHA